MKSIKTIDAVGHVLCHDITQIIKGVTKDARFRKGHVVTQEDIPVLLSLGKDHLYVWEKKEGMLHENEAAEILREICQSDHMIASPVKEGKIELSAACDGVLKIDVDKLHAINALDEITIATRHNHTPVKKGDKLAGMRVVPLVIDEKKVQKAKEIAGEQSIFQLLPYQKMKAGVVTTGNEVFYGRIQDTFTPVLMQKLESYGAVVQEHRIVNDDPDKITKAIEELIACGVDLILCTGGMSVDPDDMTPAAIKATGAQMITYGVPVLPGAMFLLAYYQGKLPIMGLPGCVMYAKTTIFDLVLPRVIAGEKIEKMELMKLGHGGLCLECPVCTYPACSFGKGV
ncbi:molybdopterin-binding protein [Anaerosinus massiliensis]|uniref:molybdopterin-binding protein n=1 Tax=Massilibacillus massiliensis TaxID=1806837 RepID=UPI000A95AD56|nr:molybdopterin-binding protein [Massilibacillus massiliensis]